MAKTIAYAFGTDRTRTKETHRIGSQRATARADTWRTFTTCSVAADGSGSVTVVRDGKTIHSFTFGPEVTAPVAHDSDYDRIVWVGEGANAEDDEA